MTGNGVNLILLGQRSADTLAALMALEDVAFVEAASVALVGENVPEGDIDPFVFLLRSGYSKYYVLSKMAEHFGGRFHPGRLPGLRRRLKRYRLGGIPLIGGLLRRLWNMPSECIKERRARVMENQLYLLALHAYRAPSGTTLPCAPWGGVHRVDMYRSIADDVKDLPPEVQKIHQGLVEAARASVQLEE